MHTIHNMNYVLSRNVEIIMETRFLVYKEKYPIYGQVVNIQPFYNTIIAHGPSTHPSYKAIPLHQAISIPMEIVTTAD